MSSRISAWALDLFFPAKCVFCRRILPKDGVDICDECRLSLPIYQGERSFGMYILDFAAVFNYEGLVQDSLRRFKFNAMDYYAKAYGTLMAASVQGRLEGPFDLVTWCPISAKRRRKRGYDQGALLARALGKALCLPVEKTLEKTRDNPAQSAAGGEPARRANVFGVYAPVSGAQLKDKHILLVDDIATTGATLQEASRILLTAGALDVCCAVVAATQER